MKRGLFAIVLISLLIAMLAIGASAETATSGVCGDNLTWELSDNTLTISGTGPMYDYGVGEAPWFDVERIDDVIIERGVTSIGDYAFGRYKRHSNYEIPSTVTRIGNSAFLSNSNFDIFFEGGKPEMAVDAFKGAYGSCYYINGWEEEDLQNYTGSPIWVKLTMTQAPGRKNVYGINEPIKKEDLVFNISDSNNWERTYIPEEFEAEPYNNSAPGEKNVKIKVLGLEFVHSYFVTDGISHLSAVRIASLEPMRYTSRAVEPKPVVMAGSILLTEGVDYTLSYKNNVAVGTNATVTATGIGEWIGFTKTASFTIVKCDLSSLPQNWISVFASNCRFSGMPLTPQVYVDVVIKNEYKNRETIRLTAGTDFVVYYENNVNIGTATYYVVGIGNYCGAQTGTFQITNKIDTVKLKGEYNGQADGELDLEKYHYSEKTIAPGKLEAEINHDKKHSAYYELYKAVGEEWQLVDSKMYSNYVYTSYSYDFSSVYEDAMDAGGEIYMLAYSWVDKDYATYSGVCVFIIPAKVPDTTQLVVEDVAGTGNHRNAYLTAYGTDGHLGQVTWMTSDPGVATVNKSGQVTMLKPGKVTLTARYGDLSDSIELTVIPDELYRGEIVSYCSESDEVAVFYDGYILQEGTDYTKTVTAQGDEAVITVTGIGVFEGQLVRHFNAFDEPLGHCHAFMNLCSSHCIGCDYERTTVHTHTRWYRDGEKHWRVCTVCGEKTDEAAHSFAGEAADDCVVCGPLHIAGDLDGSYHLDEDDAVYLLQHVLMPDLFPVDKSVDYDQNGRLDEDDAVYLLQHVLMPDLFPL